MVNDIAILIFLILMLLTFLIVIPDKGKNRLFVFFPLLDIKSNIIFKDSENDSHIKNIKFGKIINIVLIMFIIFTLVFSNGKYGDIYQCIFLTILLLFIFNWVIYVIWIVFANINKFMSGIKNSSMIFLFLLPIMIIVFESLLGKDCNIYVKIIFDNLCLILEILLLVYTIKFMIKIFLDKSTLCDRNDKLSWNSLTTSLMGMLSVIIIQLLNFISIIYTLNLRFPGLLKYEKENVIKITDIAYFVIITYTSIGYGDIIPNCLMAKVLVCIIGLSGFFTSTCLIGTIIKNFSGITTQDD